MSDQSFPKKLAIGIYAKLWVWTYKLSSGMWNAFNHENKYAIFSARLFMAILIFPFMWIAAFVIYITYIIPATIYGGTAIVVWANIKQAKWIADAAGVKGIKRGRKKRK